MIQHEECSIEETNFILEEISGTSEQEKEISIVNTLNNNFQIEYSSVTMSYLKINPNVIAEIEDNILRALTNQKVIELKKLYNSNNMYRLRIGSYNFIFEIDDLMIRVVDYCNRYLNKNEDISDSIEEIISRFPKVLGTAECLDYIKKNNASLCRFGDGELNLCLNENIGFQNSSKRIKDRLLEVLSYKSDKNILVTIPEFNSKYNNIKNCFGEVSFWENYWLEKFNLLMKHFNSSFYGNTDITRNSVFYENSLDDIIEIWDKRDIVLVSGIGGRFELKKTLFSNIASIKEIHVPAQNAFDTYDAILEECLKESKEKLFLLACGPTATILAFDLMQNNYQALDIGHLPNSYDQFLGNIISPETIPMYNKQ